MYYNMNNKMAQIPSTNSKNIRIASNGRVDLLNPPDISNLFALYDKIPANQCTTFRNATLGQLEETPMSLAYFSKENIQIIQNGIRAGVYNKSNGQYLIGLQDCDQLKIIMRAMFLQYSANMPTNIPEQIHELNKMVLEFAVPRVYGEAQGYIKYLYDASTLAVPLSTPVCDTQYGRRVHKMPKWF
jgi:hypothetical protein